MEAILEPEKQYVLKDVMKRRKKDLDAVENKLKAKQLLKSSRPKKETIKLPDKFVKKYRAAQRSFADLKRRTIKALQREPEAADKERLLLVVRIRGVHDISNVQSRILHNLNLREVNTAVFMRSSKKNLLALKRIENYITYGYPSRKLVQDLVYKKLAINVGGERKLLNTNQQVEENIGGDVVCLEDVISNLVGVGPAFETVVKVIWPFKLTTAEGALQSRMRKPFSQGGEWGFRDNLISDFVSKMI